MARDYACIIRCHRQKLRSWSFGFPTLPEWTNCIVAVFFLHLSYTIKETQPPQKKKSITVKSDTGFYGVLFFLQRWMRMKKSEKTRSCVWVAREGLSAELQPSAPSQLHTVPSANTCNPLGRCRYVSQLYSKCTFVSLSITFFMQKLYGLEHSKCTFVSLSITFFMWKLYGYWLYRTLTKEILIAFCRHPRLGAFTIASDHVNGPYFPYMTATVTFCTINCKQDEKKVKLQTLHYRTFFDAFQWTSIAPELLPIHGVCLDRTHIAMHNTQYTTHNIK